MNGMLRLTEEQLAAMVRKNRPRVVARLGIEEVALTPVVEAKPKKYRNKKVDLDGRTFDSIKERDRYLELKFQERAALITDLRFQVRYPLTVNGMEVAAYVADFVYRDVQGKERIEDVKGYKGGPAYAMFRLKKKLMKACLGIDVEEV